jgi:predicted ABC-type ATPase
MSFLYIIAGCNGAGKTTASYTILPQMLNCKEFVNADEIAKGLSPLQPETVSFEAGRIMLTRIRELIDGGGDFAFETTLSTRSYLSLVREAQAKGFIVTLVFFWLESIDLAKRRVAQRVSEGGHNIPPDVIERRYGKGLLNLRSFIKVVDNWVVCDNTNGLSKQIADGNRLGALNVYNHDIWTSIVSYGK